MNLLNKIAPFPRIIWVEWVKNIALVIILTLNCSTSHANPGVAPSEGIKKVAKEGMKDFLKSDRIEHLHNQGFDSEDDLKNATLGDGFEIFTISPEKILDESSSQNLQSLVTSTKQWCFFITVNGEIKTIVTVALIDDKWTTTELGSPEFAKIMGKLFSIWPASAGYRFRYVRVYQANASFVEVYLRDELIGIVPSKTLMGYLGITLEEYDPTNLVSPNGVRAALRPAVKHNIEEWKHSNKTGEQQ